MEYVKPKKRKFNKKSVYSSVSIILVVFVIVSSTLFQASVDPNYWKTNAFISSVLINIALIMVGVVSGVGEADNYYHNLLNGLYQTTYNKYRKMRDSIDRFVDKFTFWNTDYFEREKKDKYIKYLDKYGIKQGAKLLELDRVDIAKLDKPQQINGTYFKSLTQEQIEAIYRVLNGKIKSKPLHEDYFLNAFISDQNVSMYERAGNQEKNKNKKFIKLITYRILMTLTVALIFAGLQIDTNNDVTMQQIWVNMITRLWALGNAVAYGFFTSYEMTKDECIFIDYKTTVLNKFYLEVVENKTFNSKTAEDLARDEYEREVSNNGEIRECETKDNGENI